MDETTTSEPEAPEVEPAPLLTLRDGLPEVVETEEALAAACAALRAASGPVAIDAERASGYRYSARAYLIQLRREGAGTWLIDPIAFKDLAPLQEALAGTEWILHAATQDLACLREVGLEPESIFDTELAGRLLGYPRVGLATLVETLLGQRMRKEHSAADWSTRPLPRAWLDYAALDVEVLARAACADGHRARGDRQGRVGPPGVRPPARLRADREAGRLAADVRVSTGCAAAARWQRPRHCGRRATRSRPNAT